MSNSNAARGLGPYWGIDTDQTGIPLPDALPVPPLDVSKLAQVATRLSDPGDDVSKGLINWGYAIADRSIRAHYRGPEPIAGPSPSFPL